MSNNVLLLGEDNLPVVVVTSSAQDEDLVRSLDEPPPGRQT